MSDIRWVGNHIEVDPPPRPKKITGTRFGAILGANRWTTPFKAWCEITRTWEEPFVDTKYTRAGKVIEPKQAQYLHEAYNMPNIFSPADQFGENYFKDTHGDFFKHDKIFGGMWDYVVKDIRGHPKLVLEMKTTKRAEDWQDDIPEYYALQAALYTRLLGLDDVAMVCSFLKEEDYEHPENYVPGLDNTVVVPFKVSVRYPNFKDLMEEAETFWNEHVITGVSPDYDERKDQAILRDLKTRVAPVEDIASLLRDAEAVKRELDYSRLKTSHLEATMKPISDKIKQYAKEHFKDGDDRIVLKGQNFEWTITRSTTSRVDQDALNRDGLLGRYTKTEETYRLTAQEKGENIK